MLFQEEEQTGAQVLQQVRCERFAKQAAERIKSAENCLFSKLLDDELLRLAGDWYDACAEAMLRGNYAPIDIWIRSQSRHATAQGFTPGDLLQLLLICRRSAIETESWNEDIFSVVDDVMQEAFGSIHGDTPWNMSLNLEHDLGATDEDKASVPIAEVERWSTERRRFARNRLRFPVRISGSSSDDQVEDIIQTCSVSRCGLYFVTAEEYKKDQVLKITFPYWNVPGGINGVYAAKVVRVERRQDRTWGVGVHFQEGLGRKA